MNIPTLQANNELPPGEYATTLDEIEYVFGSSNEHRRKLFKGLKDAAYNFKSAGVKTLWINGSFVTSKIEPNDIDGCWEYTTAVNLDVLDPILLSRREKMKEKYGLDFFIANYTEAKSGLPFPQFFQKNRDGNAKGILILDLGRNS